MLRLWIITILSFINGSFFVITDERKRCFLDFAKGYLNLFLAGTYLHSGLSYLLASCAVLAGHTKPLFYKTEKTTNEWVALGIIFFLSPLFGLIIIICYAILNKIFKNYCKTVFATYLLVPFLSFIFFKRDAYILTCFIIFINITVQFWPSSFKVKSSSINRVIFSISGLLLIALVFSNKYVYKGFGFQKDIIRQGPHHFKYVAITFDDGPDPEFTPEILDILKQKDVKATFFLVGKNVERYPSIAKRIAEEGHLLGNHTYSHKSLIPLSKNATVSEIKKAENAILNATGQRPTLFRPPRGIYSDFARKFLQDERYTIVLWDVSAIDWAELSPNSIVANVMNNTGPGSIILLHDSGDLVKYKGGDRTSTVKALPQIIDNLRREGYEFITIDQMIFISELMETEEKLHESDTGAITAY